MEASEIHEFAEQMKEGGEESLRSISLAISILAVLVAMVTVLGHRAHTEAILQQSRAGDHWNLYEAKRIREENLMVVTDLLQLQPVLDAKVAAAKVIEYQGQIAQWKLDMTDEQAKALGFEHGADKAEHKAERFDLGEAMLQIAVVLSSITLFTRRRSYFFGGLSLGIAGLVIAASAWMVQ